MYMLRDASLCASVSWVLFVPYCCMSAGQLVPRGETLLHTALQWYSLSQYVCCGSLCRTVQKTQCKSHALPLALSCESPLCQNVLLADTQVLHLFTHLRRLFKQMRGEGIEVLPAHIANLVHACTRARQFDRCAELGPPHLLLPCCWHTSTASVHPRMWLPAGFRCCVRVASILPCHSGIYPLD